MEKNNINIVIQLMSCVQLPVTLYSIGSNGVPAFIVFTLC